MKTLCEIRKALGEAIAEASWVVDDGDMHDLRDACDTARKIMADALALIRQLEAEKEAMMNDMRECSHCAHHDVDEIYTDCCYDCNACDHDGCPCKECSGYNKWEWRGVQKEKSK